MIYLSIYRSINFLYYIYEKLYETVESYFNKYDLNMTKNAKKQKRTKGSFRLMLFQKQQPANIQGAEAKLGIF